MSGRPASLTATDRRILALAIPALGSLAVEPLYVLVDTAIVGRLGTAQLGGLALAATVLSFVVAGCNFLTYGTTERVARRLGAGRAGRRRRRRRAGDVARGARRCAAGARHRPRRAAGRPALLGADGDVLDFAATYLRISAVGVPFIVFTLAAQGVLRGAADYRTPLVILLTANVVNAVLEVDVRVRVRLGCARLGVVDRDRPGRRAAIAFAVARSAAGSPAPTTAARAGAGMAPLLTAGRHLLLRVGSMLAVLGGATAVAARDRRADAGRPPDRVQRVPAPRPRRSTPWPSRPRRSSPSSWGAVDARRPPAGRPACRAAVGGRRRRARRRRRRRPRRCSPTPSPADDAVVARATSALWWLAVVLVPAADRLRLRRRADRRRRLPLPRPRRLRATCSPWRPLGAARARRPAPASPASGSASPCGWCCGRSSTTAAPAASSAPSRLGAERSAGRGRS